MTVTDDGVDCIDGSDDDVDGGDDDGDERIDKRGGGRRRNMKHDESTGSTYQLRGSMRSAVPQSYEGVPSRESINYTSVRESIWLTRGQSWSVNYAEGKYIR